MRVPDTFLQSIWSACLCAYWFMFPLVGEPLKPSHRLFFYLLHYSLKFISYFIWVLMSSSSSLFFNNKKYTWVSVANISSLLFESWMVSWYKSKSELFMTSSEYVSSLSLTVDQIIILTVRFGFDHYAWYMFRPVIVYGRFFSYLKG